MSESDYRTLVETARTDERVLGLVLTGSRGRRVFVRPGSDWDVRLIVRDDARAECEQRFLTTHGSPVEVVVFTLSEFKRAGEFGTPDEWDRYSYAHAEVVLDKLDGGVMDLVAEKAFFRLSLRAQSQHKR